MENIDQIKIYLESGFIRIIVREQMIPLTALKWNDVYDCGGWLSLGEIASQLKNLGHQDVYYVWQDTPLQGRIYQYGNYDPESWIVYGRTQGFA